MKKYIVISIVNLQSNMMAYGCQVVEQLLKHGANKDHRNVHGKSPLSMAAAGGYVDIVLLLLNAGAEINSRAEVKLYIVLIEMF